MKRKSRVGKLDTASATTFLTDSLAPMAGGLIVGEYADQLPVDILQQNPLYLDLAKIAGGGLLYLTQDGFLGKMGVGLAASGVMGRFQKAFANGVNLLPPGQPSYYIANSNYGNSGTGYKVQ
ncbi:MAG: hypothetical protein ACRC78_05650 [Planktothrix sp.]